MAVRYFCDNCGTETPPGTLEVVVIAVPPESATFDVCPECVGHFRGELDRCREIKRSRELALPPGGRDRALVAYRAVAETGGVRAVARGLSYVAIFLVFFFAVTLLTSIR